MKRWMLVVAIACSFGALAMTAADAIAVPNTVNFTGRITQAGDPIPDGTVNITFELWTAAVGGSSTGWTETHSSVPVVNGLVHVELGSMTGFTGTDFDGSVLYLEVTVNGDTQSPRVQISSVPYSIRSATSDTLGDYGPTDFSLTTHTHANYALTTHNHDSDYAALSHTHANYALTTHNHDTDYAALSHTHANYALTSHTHSGYASTSHTHTTADISNSTSNTSTLFHDCEWVYTSATSTNVTATCPAGKYPITGGCGVLSTVSNMMNKPSPNGSGGVTSKNGWYCHYTSSASINAHALCCRY